MKERIAGAPGRASVADAPMAPAPAAAAAVSPLAAPQPEARLEGALRLTRETSAKDTPHVAFPLEDPKARPDAADASAVFAHNGPSAPAACGGRPAGASG